MRYKQVRIRFEKGIHDEIIMVNETRMAETIAELFGPEARKDIDMCDGFSTHDEPVAKTGLTFLDDETIEANRAEREERKKREAEEAKEIGLRIGRDSLTGDLTVYAVDRYGDRVPRGKLISFENDGRIRFYSGINEELGFRLVGGLNHLRIAGDHPQVEKG